LNYDAMCKVFLEYQHRFLGITSHTRNVNQFIRMDRSDWSLHGFTSLRPQSTLGLVETCPTQFFMRSITIHPTVWQCLILNNSHWECIVRYFSSVPTGLNVPQKRTIQIRRKRVAGMYPRVWHRTKSKAMCVLLDSHPSMKWDFHDARKTWYSRIESRKNANNRVSSLHTKSMSVPKVQLLSWSN
jgi:hypothetical protein